MVPTNVCAANAPVLRLRSSGGPDIDVTVAGSHVQRSQLSSLRAARRPSNLDRTRGIRAMGIFRPRFGSTVHKRNYKQRETLIMFRRRKLGTRQLRPLDLALRTHYSQSSEAIERPSLICALDRTEDHAEDQDRGLFLRAPYRYANHLPSSARHARGWIQTQESRSKFDNARRRL